MVVDHVPLGNPDVSSLEKMKNEDVDRLEDVPGDGSCLYHCLHQLAITSAGKLTKPNTDIYFKNNSDLRRTLGRHILANADEFVKTWGDQMKQVVAARKDRPSKDMSGYTNKELVEEYTSVQITHESNPWGGDIEIDVASSYFGVVIRKYEYIQLEDEDSGSMYLKSTFFPNEATRDHVQAAEKKEQRASNFVQWRIALKYGHFNYVVEDIQGDLSSDELGYESFPVRTTASEHARDIKMLADRKKEGRTAGTTQPESNQLLREMHQLRLQRNNTADVQKTCQPNPYRAGMEDYVKMLSMEAEFDLKKSKSETSDDDYDYDQWEEKSESEDSSDGKKAVIF